MHYHKLIMHTQEDLTHDQFHQISVMPLTFVHYYIYCKLHNSALILISTHLHTARVPAKQSLLNQLVSQWVSEHSKKELNSETMHCVPAVPKGTLLGK